MEKKYKYEDASQADNDKFASAFAELLKQFPDLSVTTNIVSKSINIKMDDGKMETVYYQSPTLLIQKKIEIAEAEVVSPIQSDDLAKN